MRLSLILACCSLHASVSQIACGTGGDVGQGGYAWTAANQPTLASQAAPYNALRASYGSSPITYMLTVPAGPATVTLQFIEPNKTAVGQRVFGVAINGDMKVASLDLFASAGLLIPYSQAFQVTSAGTVTIVLTATTGNAVISGIQVNVPDASANMQQCEDGPSTGGYGNGGLLPSVYSTFSCENMTGAPLRITKFRCRSDVDGQTGDLQVADATGELHSVLTAPTDCSPLGVDGTIVAGSALPDHAVLWWFARVAIPTDPGAPLVKQVLMTAVLEP